MIGILCLMIISLINADTSNGTNSTDNATVTNGANQTNNTVNNGTNNTVNNGTNNTVNNGTIDTSTNSSVITPYSNLLTQFVCDPSFATNVSIVYYNIIVGGQRNSMHPLYLSL
jgi:hypothetical protein